MCLSRLLVYANDLQNSRCFSVEKAVTEEMPEKTMIILLTKIDLVPKDILEKVFAWIEYDEQTIASLSAQFPVICWMNSTIAQFQTKTKRHDPLASRYIEIAENKREQSYRKFNFGCDYLMKVRYDDSECVNNELKIASSIDSTTT